MSKRKKEEISDFLGYLDNISEEYLNELYEKVEDKMDFLDKKNNIYLSYNIKILKEATLLSSREIEEIEQVIKGNIPNNISDKLMDSIIFFDKYGDKKYFISKDIKDLVKEINTKEYDSDKKLMNVLFYIEANGVIKINRLIKLVKDTGIDITKSEIKDMLEQFNYYIKDDVIYFAEELYKSGLGTKLLKEKEKLPYKTYSQFELFMLTPMIVNSVYYDKIHDFMSKKVKDEDRLQHITDMLITIVRMFDDYKDTVLFALDNNKIKLPQKTLEKLFDILEDASLFYPKWILNGEILGGNSEYEDFNELTCDEKIDIYVEQYMMINGVIELDKMIEILEYHDIKKERKELIKIIKKHDGIDVYKNYICFSGMEGMIKEILSSKRIKEYKIIENPNELIDELEYGEQKIKDICLKYGVEEYAQKGIFCFMNYGTFNRDMLNSILIENKNVFTKNIINNLYKELLKLSKDIRTWIYNGYTENEVKLLKK